MEEEEEGMFYDFEMGGRSWRKLVFFIALNRLDL